MPNIKVIANEFFEFSQKNDLLLPEIKKIFNITFPVITTRSNTAAKEFNDGLINDLLQGRVRNNSDMFLFGEINNVTEHGDDSYIEYQGYESKPIHKNKDSMWKIAKDGENEYIFKSLKEKGYKFSINKHHDAKIVDLNFEADVDGKITMKSIIMELDVGEKPSRIVIEPDYFDGMLKETGKRNDPNYDISDEISAPKQLADWSRIRPEIIKSLDNNDEGSGTHYDYQIIFQLSGEREIVEGDERLASKHPDRTIIIQYDLETAEHKIVYGDLQKSQGDNIRWILSSHGSDNVDGTNTTLAGYKPNEVILGLQKIKEKLNLTKPKHVVIAGCNLGNERNINHFGLDFSRGLWATGINASVKAYNQDLTVNIIGQKNTIDSENQQYGKNKYHRITYIKDEYGNIIVNDVMATSLLINDIVNERVSLDDAIKIYPDILGKDFYQNGAISRDLILDVINNDDSYLNFNLFLDEKIDKYILGDQLFTDWSMKRNNRKGMLNLWGYVNAEEIYNNKLIEPTPLDYDYQVIIQLADDEVIVRSTQELASKHPDKTLIIQYDITSGESRFVYGNPNKLQGDKIKWILTGHGDGDENSLDGHSADKVYNALQDLVKRRGLIAPERVVILSCELGKNPDTDGIVPHFSLKYAEMAQKNGEELSLRAYTQEIIIDADGHRKKIVYGKEEGEGQLYTKESSHRVDYKVTKNGQVLINDIPVASYILLEIAADKITPSEAVEKYSQHLKYFFSDENNKIDKKLLAQAARDPLVWEKFSAYAEKTQHDPSAHQYNNWAESIDGGKARVLSQRTRKTVTNLDALATVKTAVTTDGIIKPELQHDLTQTTAKPTAFQSLGQKVGAGTQVIGALTLSISTYGMAKRLQDPNISEEERAEITKQLAISWSSLSVDFGTDLMQPTFDKAYNVFSKKLLSGAYAGTGRLGYKMAAKTARFAGTGLNLASAGFDIHEAIEHFSKAVNEKNPDLRTDSIVNGSLAVIGAAVSIATAIALAIGASAAGPIGIIAGAGIMFGGMIYNAVRQVEYIKREIELTGWQEFKTGFRLAFGAEPEQEILDKLSEEQKRKMHEFRVELVNTTYNKIIQPMGFNTLLYVNEKVDLTPVKKYIFIYKLDSRYSGSTEEWLRKYTNDPISGYLSDQDIRGSVSTDLSRSDMERYYIMRYKRKPLSANDYQKWRETVNVEDFDIVEINESDLDNRHSQDNLIIKNDELFKTHSYLNGLSDSWLVNNEVTTTIEISKNIDGNINTNFNFYEYSTTESIRTNQYGNNPDKSTHFNPGRGNDIIVGYKEHRNSFDVGEGEKIFIGGDKEDTFYLMGDVRASSHSRTTVLDGQGGSDTLILLGLRFGKGYYVDLERGMAKYIDDELSVASVSNIENVYGHDGFYNEIKGDMNDNFLKVGDGEAYLEGRAGNDILALNRGVAIGGFGVDTYVISSNEITPINVTIIDTGRDELSSILLPVNVVDIRSILLSGNDVIISVDEKKHSDGKILLKDVYHTNDDKNVLSHGYIINTMDGFVLLPNWPMELNQNTAASSLEMTAIYNYFADKTLYKKNGIPIKPLNLTSHKEEVDRDYMRIDDRVVFFPEFIKCSSEANGIIPHQMFGTKENEIFSNFGMGDLVAGNGGNDVINIPNLATSTKSYKNNMEIFCSPLARLIDDNKENTITLVFDNVSCYDLKIKNIDHGSQLEIYHKDSKDEYMTIQLYDPSALVSVSGKKTITLIDKNNTVFYIENNGSGYDIVEEDSTSFNIAEGKNDNIYAIEKEVAIDDYLSDQGIFSNYYFQTNNHKIQEENLGLLIDSMAKDLAPLKDMIREPVGQIYGADFGRTWAVITAG